MIDPECPECGTLATKHKENVCLALWLGLEEYPCGGDHKRGYDIYWDEIGDILEELKCFPYFEERFNTIFEGDEAWVMDVPSTYEIGSINIVQAKTAILAACRGIILHRANDDKN